MKFNKFALTLTAAALLPTFAYAGADQVAASFERDLYREPVSSSIVITGETDPLVDIFDAALNGTSDPVLASFERDIIHEPIKSAAIASKSDAFTVEFYAALNGKHDPVLASFERDMYRAPMTTGITAHGEDDVLTMEFYAALRDVLDRSAMHAAASGRPGS